MGTPASIMSTARSHAEMVDWNGRTASPDGEMAVTDESRSADSALLTALRAALARVVSAIRAFGATLPDQTGKPRTEVPWFGDYEKVEEAKTATIWLPLPEVLQARVDHDRTKTWEVKTTTWIPWRADQDKLRDAVMQEAQKLVGHAAASAENIQAADLVLSAAEMQLFG